MRSYEEQELHDEFMATGDPRYCPRHPGQQITSACGRFDAPCGRCEALMDYEMDYEAELQERIETRTETGFDIAYINARFEAAARECRNKRSVGSPK